MVHQHLTQKQAHVNKKVYGYVYNMKNNEVFYMLEQIKRSLVHAGLAEDNAGAGYRIKTKSLKRHYGIIAAITRGDVKVEIVDEKPTDNVSDLQKQYKQIPKNGLIFYKDVKQAYPEIAESLRKELFKDKDRISVQEILKMIEEFEVDDKFWVSLDKWEKLQKDLEQEQIVVQLNIDDTLRKAIKADEAISTFFKDFFDKIVDIHPAHGQTIGWARVYKFPDKWIIEEIQSDLLSADTKISDKLNNLIDNMAPENIAKVGSFLQKSFIDWDKKLVGTIIEMARSAGIAAIWIFDDDYKQKYTNSKSKLKRYYKEIPRDLGFKRQKLFVENKEIPAWYRAVASLHGKR